MTRVAKASHLILIFSFASKMFHFQILDSVMGFFLSHFGFKGVLFKGMKGVLLL
jgi:hypothetical protein